MRKLPLQKGTSTSMLLYNKKPTEELIFPTEVLKHAESKSRDYSHYGHTEEMLKILQVSREWPQPHY